MRLSSKIIEEVVMDLAGEDVVKLVNILKDRNNVSEFKLADSMKEEVNKVRNMLYRLHDFNLVSFVRKKDKKKGWYIYYWTFNTKRIKDLILLIKQKKLTKLKERLERERANKFYSCNNKCIRLDFDQSINFEFKCPECGQLINEEDNLLYIKNLEKEIENVEKELKDAKKR